MTDDKMIEAVAQQIAVAIYPGIRNPDDWADECLFDEPGTYKIEAAARAAIAAARPFILEEAAEVAQGKYVDNGCWDGHYRNAGNAIASAIRSLKDKP